MFLIVHQKNTGTLDKVEILGIINDNVEKAKEFFYEKLRENIKEHKEYIPICRYDKWQENSELLANGKIVENYFFYNKRESKYPEDTYYIKDKYELLSFENI